MDTKQCHDRSKAHEYADSAYTLDHLDTHLAHMDCFVYMYLFCLYRYLYLDTKQCHGRSRERPLHELQQAELCLPQRAALLLYHSAPLLLAEGPLLPSETMITVRQRTA